MSDNVNHPTHYTAGKVECIEAIEASMSKTEYEGYLKGNAMKYLWRYRNKGKAQEDLEKARWYLQRLLERQTETQEPANCSTCKFFGPSQFRDLYECHITRRPFDNNKPGKICEMYIKGETK